MQLVALAFKPSALNEIWLLNVDPSAWKESPIDVFGETLPIFELITITEQSRLSSENTVLIFEPMMRTTEWKHELNTGSRHSTETLRMLMS